MSETPERDLVDARLVVDVAVALRRWGEERGKTPPTKVLREAVWFFWQKPRLDRPLVAGKYPRNANWSEAAAALVIEGHSTADGLVIEHVRPMNFALRWLIEEAPGVEQVAAELSDRLQCVVVTTEESAMLPHVGDPEERYAAAGLDLDSFQTLDQWASSSPARTVPEEFSDITEGDVRWDFMGREFTVLQVLDDGLEFEYEDGHIGRLGWHGLMTIGVLRAPPESLMSPPLSE